MDSKKTQTDGSMTERGWVGVNWRFQQRLNVHSHLAALDVASSVVLGNLEDISLTGFRLQPRGTMSRGTTGDLRIVVRIDGLEFPYIDVKARNIWSHYLYCDGIARAGFVFVDLSPAALGRTQAVFTRLDRLA